MGKKKVTTDRLRLVGLDPHQIYLDEEAKAK